MSYTKNGERKVIDHFADFEERVSGKSTEGYDEQFWFQGKSLLLSDYAGYGEFLDLVQCQFHAESVDAGVLSDFVGVGFDDTLELDFLGVPGSGEEQVDPGFSVSEEFVQSVPCVEIDAETTYVFKVVLVLSSHTFIISTKKNKVEKHVVRNVFKWNVDLADRREVFLLNFVAGDKRYLMFLPKCVGFYELFLKILDFKNLSSLVSCVRYCLMTIEKNPGPAGVYSLAEMSSWAGEEKPIIVEYCETAKVGNGFSFMLSDKYLSEQFTSFFFRKFPDKLGKYVLNMQRGAAVVLSYTVPGSVKSYDLKSMGRMQLYHTIGGQSSTVHASVKCGDRISLTCIGSEASSDCHFRVSLVFYPLSTFRDGKKDFLHWKSLDYVFYFTEKGKGEKFESFLEKSKGVTKAYFSEVSSEWKVFFPPEINSKKAASLHSDMVEMEREFQKMKNQKKNQLLNAGVSPQQLELKKFLNKNPGVGSVKGKNNGSKKAYAKQSNVDQLGGEVPFVRKPLPLLKRVEEVEAVQPKPKKLVNVRKVDRNTVSKAPVSVKAVGVIPLPVSKSGVVKAVAKPVKKSNKKENNLVPFNVMYEKAKVHKTSLIPKDFRIWYRAYEKDPSILSTFEEDFATMWL